MSSNRLATLDPTKAFSYSMKLHARRHLENPDRGIDYVNPNEGSRRLGTNFMDFPGFIAANNADTPEGLAKTVARVPMGRLGTVEECATLCCAYLDGTCGFVTGQFIAHDGGWS